ADRLTRSHLVICRAGASSLADLTVVGRPAILIPLAIAVRDEQTANARPLVEAGAAQMIQEDELTPEHLAESIASVIDAPEAARAAATASRSLGKPDAAERLADLVITTAAAG
ncbi:MAG: glycosyltransferase, partial [Pseudomonadota bacterium]